MFFIIYISYQHVIKISYQTLILISNLKYYYFKIYAMQVKNLTGILVFKTVTQESKENIIWQRFIIHKKVMYRKTLWSFTVVPKKIEKLSFSIKNERMLFAWNTTCQFEKFKTFALTFHIQTPILAENTSKMKA